MDRQQETDAATSNSISPDKKRTKVTNPRLSLSDKGKTKASFVPFVYGSLSVGAKRNVNRDIKPTVPRMPSTNVIDLTTPDSVRCFQSEAKPHITKVYARRKHKGPSLNLRTTPAAFHDALKKLNDAQKSAVRDIGFGRLLELKVKDIPARLAYWVQNKFNPETCELEIDARRRVAVTQGDVYRIFGFPCGNQSIKIFERKSNSDLFEQWFSFFGVENRDKIKIGLVLDVMLGCKCGGTWFKRHFMIAMGFSLFESYPTGTVHPYILGCLSEMRNLGRWNWAEYMIGSLKKNSKTWGGDENKVYAGPVLFLILFYVDRLHMPGSTSKREFPIFINWSSAALRKRQSMELDEEDIVPVTIVEPIQLPNYYTEYIGEYGISEEERLLSARIMADANEIAERMKKLSLLVDGAPVTAKKSPFFVKTVKEACNLTGITIDLNIPTTKSQTSTTEIEIEDEIEYPEEFLRYVDSVSGATSSEEKKMVRPKAIDIPSFDLTILDDEELDVNQNKAAKDQEVIHSPVMGLVCPERRSSPVGRVTSKKLMLGSTYPHPLVAFGAKDAASDCNRLPLRSIENMTVGSGIQTPPQIKKGLNLRTSNFQSQNVQRGICTRLQLGSREKQIGMYALYKDAGEETKVLFSYKDIVLRRYDLTTLKRGHCVKPSVINAWSIILNGDERCRPEYPTRFFASTEIHVDCIAPIGQSYQQKQKSFFNQMMLEIQEYQINPVSLIDMFFFPIYEDPLLYAICVDTIRQRLFVLDSTIDCHGSDYCDKYNQLCNSLCSMLSDYLYYINEDRKALIVLNSPIEIVRMKWSDVRNEVDSGVYLMRHLETFMGDSSHNWDCNMSKSSARQICRMRVRYCSSILMWSGNDVRQEVVEEAVDYYSQLCASGATDFDVKLMG
ncbi:uncharacterized protein LOC131010675 isoform X2 [Salvia miltiorrhiza]|uniref:uncharacterized protein LOC131010675 isoform X2 n=1 Tax=Salvia miltiorrhiza TaxID=226208 RepID=UPI0025AC508D|nr:uncharacterized protein LOC131010675 isoform X2 [Salvia miltiorrhiza]